MRKRWMTLVGLVAVLALAMGGTAAYAQEAPPTDLPSTDAAAEHDLPPADDEGEVTVDGRGVLRARGNGTAVLRGGGKLGMRIHGAVGIVDHVGDARLVIDGRGHQLQRERLLVLRGTYQVEIRGTGFTVRTRGDQSFKAVGQGIATLKGRGWYRTSGGLFGTWTPRGVNVGHRPA